MITLNKFMFLKYFKNHYFLLLITILLAIAIRLIGISYGLPHMYVVDESQVVFDAARFHPNVLLRPLTFSVYGPLMSILINFFFLIYGSILFILGQIRNSTDLYLIFETNKTPFFLIARSLSVVCQVLTILIVFLISKKFFKSKLVGIFAGLFLTFSISFVNFGRIAESESLLALLCSVAIYIALKILQEDKIKDYLLLGLTIGLAISTKYNAYLFILLIPLVHLLNCFQRKDYKGILLKKGFYFSLIFVIIGIFIGHPHLWLKVGVLTNELIRNPKEIINIVYPSYNFATSALRTGWPGKEIHLNQLWIFKAIILNENMFGYLIFGSIIFGFIRHKKSDLILLFLTLTYLLVISTYTRIGDDIHYLFPVFPVFALLCGQMLNDLLIFLRFKHLKVFFLLLLFNFFLLPVIKYDITYAVSLTKKDTRDVSGEWVNKNLVSGVKIVTNPYSPELFDPKADPQCSAYCDENRVAPKLLDYAKNHPWYQILPFRYRESEPIWPKNWSKEMLLKYKDDYYVRGESAWAFRDCNYFIKENVKYLILSSGEYGRYLLVNSFPKSNPFYELFERNKKAYQDIFEGRQICLKEIKEFKPTDKVEGPIIKIYEVSHPQ